MTLQQSSHPSSSNISSQYSITVVNEALLAMAIMMTISADGKESSKEFGLLKQGSSGFEIDDDPFSVAKKELAAVESQCDDHKNVIRVLERALDEEHAGRTALYLELEKERIAASTAAEEALAMILRLREEKAAIEMEAKQYLRMIEEKATFDDEEMNILKEILLREREKLFLEKEVEAYMQMFFNKDQLY
ncbi:myosin-binding protein 2-like [Hibiscus syriacus]|uniref:myosin-binding protein 2-like n=1 Tax=Hibiscus syriacus TaxID=106335 RepID=UPI001921FAA9|nr:myosin-binding protein 2-like [Hibiscus syriacus]